MVNLQIYLNIFLTSDIRLYFCVSDAFQLRFTVRGEKNIIFAFSSENSLFYAYTISNRSKKYFFIF